MLTQRSQTYDIFTESYHVSELQKVYRQTQTWPVKPRIEFNVSSRNPRLSQNLSMESPRGVRGTTSRYLRDGNPNPAYVVEWEVPAATEGELVLSTEKTNLEID